MTSVNHRLVSFVKMHGLGNDFIVINSLGHPFSLKPDMIKHLANRHVGIGFDQLLLIEDSKHADFFCRIFNADGSEASQCGNGLRCVARYIHEQGLSSHHTMTLETLAGIFPLRIHDYDHIEIDMGAPGIEHIMTELELPGTGEQLSVSILSTGNPHAIVRVDSLSSANFDVIAPRISSHPHFPDGVNVGFMQVIDQKHVILRTHERGSGPTMACGSNACAAVVAGISNGWLEQTVKVEFEYGSLEIAWKGGNHPIRMTGSAVNVYKGEIKLQFADL